jgi:hypothetical protein
MLYHPFKNTKTLLKMHNFTLFLSYLVNIVLYNEKSEKNKNINNSDLLDDFFSFFDYYYHKTYYLQDINPSEDLFITVNEKKIKKSFKSFCNTILFDTAISSNQNSQDKIKIIHKKVKMDIKTLLMIFNIGKGFEFDSNMLFSKSFQDPNTNNYLTETYKNTKIIFDPQKDQVMLMDGNLYLLPYLINHRIK